MYSTPDNDPWCQYKDAGAEAKDHGDGNLGRDITVISNSNVESDTPGEYTVTYNAEDSHHNEATEVVRTVHVQDTTLCELSFTGDAVIEHWANSSSLCLKQTAPYSNTTNSELASAGTQTQEYCNLNPGECVPCEDAIFKSNDECDVLDQNNLEEPTWSREFDDQIVGHYVKTYHCNDTEGNSNYLTRTYIVQDRQQPIIDIEGDEDLTLEAKGPGNTEYTDDGATCTDYVDGDISHAVEVSGQIVNMHVPGQYLIDYECTDLSGNTAEMKTRTVTIVDNECPTITLLGEDHTHLEAGFDFIDSGATATDTLDGDLTDFVWTSGDTVDVREFAKLHDCGQIQHAWNEKTDKHDNLLHGSHAGGHSGNKNSTTLNDGEFLVTMQSQRRKVYCVFDGTDDGAKTYGIINDGTEQQMSSEGNCQAEGFDGKVRYKNAEAWGETTCGDYWNSVNDINDDKDPCKIEDANQLTQLQEILQDETAYHNATGHNLMVEYLDNLNSAHDVLESISTTYELCFIEHQPNPFWANDNTPDTYAAQGFYKIHYHVKDRAGNPECAPAIRTVIVTDSLPPVITLHLKNSNSRYHPNGEEKPRLIARGSHTDEDQNNNPAARSETEYLNPDEDQAAHFADRPGWNPNLRVDHDDVQLTEPSSDPKYDSTFPHSTSYMAQVASSSGLTIAAVVFAASGVAFIAFAAVSKRQAATIDV